MLLVASAEIVVACRRVPREAPKALPASEQSASRGPVPRDAAIDAPVAPVEVTIDFTGITGVMTIEGNVVGMHPSRGTLFLTNSASDDVPALSPDGRRVVFARWTQGCRPPDEFSACSELWLLTSGAAPTRLLERGARADAAPAVDLPHGPVRDLVFSKDGRKVFVNDSGYGTIGSVTCWAYDFATKGLVQLIGAGGIRREVTSGPHAGALVACGMPLNPPPTYGRTEKCIVVTAEGRVLRAIPVDESKWKTELGEK